MTARTMTARYVGTCRGCAGPVRRGDTIVYAGRSGGAWHPACHANDVEGQAVTYTPDNDPYDLRGKTWKQRYGRCEDAPCCGCCS